MYMYIYSCMNLKEVNFQIKDGINPICNQKGYLEYITHNLPRLEVYIIYNFTDHRN